MGGAGLAFANSFFTCFLNAAQQIAAGLTPAHKVNLLSSVELFVYSTINCGCLSMNTSKSLQEVGTRHFYTIADIVLLNKFNPLSACVTVTYPYDSPQRSWLYSVCRSWPGPSL